MFKIDFLGIILISLIQIVLNNFSQDFFNFYLLFKKLILLRGFWQIVRIYPSLLRGNFLTYYCIIHIISRTCNKTVFILNNIIYFFHLIEILLKETININCFIVSNKILLL